MGYLKLNVDGGLCDGKAVYGGVLRDEAGQWLWGFTCSFHGNTPLLAKVKALKVGLQQSDNRGHMHASSSMSTSCLQIVSTSRASSLNENLNSFNSTGTDENHRSLYDLEPFPAHQILSDL
ncbi:hypothetical protein LguiB_036334 [Lonicera macranthoides]